MRSNPSAPELASLLDGAFIRPSAIKATLTQGGRQQPTTLGPTGTFQWALPCGPEPGFQTPRQAPGLVGPVLAKPSTEESRFHTNNPYLTLFRMAFDTGLRETF